MINGQTEETIINVAIHDLRITIYRIYVGHDVFTPLKWREIEDQITTIRDYSNGKKWENPRMEDYK
jgi:hypothetical protein